MGKTRERSQSAGAGSGRPARRVDDGGADYESKSGGFRAIEAKPRIGFKRSPHNDLPSMNGTLAARDRSQIR